jgi:hypothetical protein
LPSNVKSLRRMQAIVGEGICLIPSAEGPSSRLGPALASKTRGLPKVTGFATRPEGLVIPLRQTRDRFEARFS